MAPPATKVVHLDQQEGLPADHRAPAQHPGHQREVRRHDARQDPPVHAALREPALEEKDEARADQQHQERIAVDAVPEPPQAGGALVLGEGHRVDLADAAMVEVAGVRVVDPVLPLPPPVGREEEVPEKVAPAAVRAPRFEQRVVCEVVEERVHPGEEDGGDEAESDGGRGARSDQCCEHPDGQVGQDDARDLSEAAALVDLQIGGEVLFPALAGGDLCGVHSALITPPHRGRISDSGLLSGGELGEVVERRRVRERVAAGRLLGGLAHQDALHRDLEDLAAQRPGHLGDLEDLVRDVARRALLADAALDLALAARRRASPPRAGPRKAASSPRSPAWGRRRPASRPPRGRPRRRGRSRWSPSGRRRG